GEAAPAVLEEDAEPPFVGGLDVELVELGAEVFGGLDHGRYRAYGTIRVSELPRNGSSAAVRKCGRMRRLGPVRRTGPRMALHRCSERLHRCNTSTAPCTASAAPCNISTAPCRAFAAACRAPTARCNGSAA